MYIFLTQMSGMILMRIQLQILATRKPDNLVSSGLAGERTGSQVPSDFFVFNPEGNNCGRNSDLFPQRPFLEVFKN